MKKVMSLVLASVIAFTAFTGCRSTATPDNLDGALENSSVAAYKIGILDSQSEEEFRAAQQMKEKYGSIIVTTAYPDNFPADTEPADTETTITNCLSLASDPLVKAIVLVQTVPGAAAAIEKVREVRPDMLFIASVPGESLEVIASKADVVFQADELAMGRTIVEQSVAMGAETLVHYSFPRHMGYALLAARRDILREYCEQYGITFVDAVAPDPTGNAGVAGAQQFILEDVPRKVAKYGVNTSFFATNCSMQETLIKRVLDEKAILAQQCCPSPYHGYPEALGIGIDTQGDIDYIIEQISEKVAEGGAAGRLGTWPVAINALMIEAGVEYARLYIEGETDGKMDFEKAVQCLENAAGGSGKITVSSYDADGLQLPNFLMILSDYVIF